MGVGNWNVYITKTNLSCRVIKKFEKVLEAHLYIVEFINVPMVKIVLTLPSNNDQYLNRGF